MTNSNDSADQTNKTKSIPKADAIRKVTFESTPNPSTLKFVLPFKITEQGFEVPTVQETDRSPLAAKIFGFPWTNAVYIGPDFITVTKQDWVEWDILAEPLSSLIQEHLNRGEAVVTDTASVETSHDENPNDSVLVKNIKKVINSEIRPVVALDGGDIVFSRFENQIVYLQMKGSCAGCPSSQATLKDGIETRLKELFPEIQEVVSV